MRRASLVVYCHIHKVRLFPSRVGIYCLALLLGLASPALQGDWQDRTVGLPPLDIITAKELGEDTIKSIVLQDTLGRIFVGSTSLLVFDGQTWRAHPKPGGYFLSALTPGAEGILWAGTTNDLGYFREETLGEFKFHSLLKHLPEEARNLGTVWACAPVGPNTYFVGKDKLLRWDGRDFQVTSFPTRLRLSPVRLGGEFWFQHLETGLYRITASGPELKFTANQLPVPLTIALFRDETGVVTVSNDGLVRAGESVPISPKALNDYLTQHKVSAFTELPDGNLAIGTLSGGLIITSRTGEIIRTWADAGTGLPGRTITSLTADPTGEILGTSPTDFFHFPATGHVSVFNALNGLRSQGATTLAIWKSSLYVTTEDGTFRQVVAEDSMAGFQQIPSLAPRYLHMLPTGDGLLLARFGGVDWFDGNTVRAAYGITANTAYFIMPVRSSLNSFYVAEVAGVARLVRHPDGSFTRTRFLELPDSVVNLHEDSAGRLWIGTITKGAFIYDPAAQQLTPVNDPANGQPLQGRTEIVGDTNRILLFLPGRVLQSGPHGGGLRQLSGLPAVTPSVVQRLPGEESIVVAYQRPDVTSGPMHGAGVISFARDGTPAWRELDLSHLNAVGSIRAVAFSEENQRRILWLGGMEGVLRLDYDKIPTLLIPTPPIIKTTDAPGSIPTTAGIPLYPFKNHHLSFRMFTGNYLQSKDWLFQTRLGTGDSTWSAPTLRRSFEFTNLSEGEYRFEVRALNAARQAGPPAVFTFRILPPWYRSAWALLGYAGAIGMGVIVVIRVRERRIRARNQELETLVGIRTAELVKANAAKDEFLAGISHEIRNPMNGVIGIADNFRTDSLDQESRRKFGLLRQCATHLSSLLEDILDFSKVQAGAVEIEAKPFNLPELMDSIAAMTAAESEKRGIPVEIAVSPAVPAQLVGDPKRVRQILLNFVSNALKFSGRGQVSVTVWCKPPGPATAEVIFAVSDEGPGISPEEQQRLFTRFERGAAAQQGRVPGTGLGLALCKGLAEKMGGRIWLESEPGRGSCFSFSAPFAIAEPAVPSLPVAPPSAPDRPRAALVVDDQEYNRIVLTDLLETLGFSVHTAGDGTAALALAGSQDFDAVFLDFNLPGLSGLEVSRGIRALSNKSAGAAILAITAFSTPEKRSQCLAAGMNAFIGKPVTMERLRKALSAAMPAGPADAPPPARPPADGLANLRLLAKKKGVPFAGELALYLSEFGVELDQLAAAVQREDAAATAHYAHLLYGRSAFIAERELEQTLRQIEAGSATGHWDEVRRLGEDLAGQVAGLRVRLVSSDPVAPPA